MGPGGRLDFREWEWGRERTQIHANKIKGIGSSGVGSDFRIEANLAGLSAAVGGLARILRNGIGDRRVPPPMEVLRRQSVLIPPSMTSSAPTVKAASSLARKTMAWAISDALPKRPAGI